METKDKDEGLVRWYTTYCKDTYIQAELALTRNQSLYSVIRGLLRFGAVTNLSRLYTDKILLGYIQRQDHSRLYRDKIILGYTETRSF